jgi:hypothetical protein
LQSDGLENIIFYEKDEEKNQLELDLYNCVDMRSVTLSPRNWLYLKAIPCTGDNCKSQEEITAVVNEGVEIWVKYGIEELDV